MVESTELHMNWLEPKQRCNETKTKYARKTLLFIRNLLPLGQINKSRKIAFPTSVLPMRSGSVETALVALKLLVARSVIVS